MKDEKYSTKVKDEQGFPCFALVNKATGQAMKHSVGASHPVCLSTYSCSVLYYVEYVWIFTSINIDKFYFKGI